jgi:NTP pyrophosphatase (non-canonical NTP hydrolase)
MKIAVTEGMVELALLAAGTATINFRRPWHDDERATVRSMLEAALATTNDLSFSELAKINLQRALRWHSSGLEEWNEAEWSNAMAGEAGEACNATKKLRRILCGMRQANGPADLYDARKNVLKEVGDTVIYACLLCQRVGGSMEEAVRYAFNQVSEREGFPERL